MNCKDLIGQLLSGASDTHLSEDRKINVILKAEKKYGPRSLVCILNLWLTGKEKDCLERFFCPQHQLPSRVGLEGDDPGAQSLQPRKKQDLGELHRALVWCQYSHITSLS